MKIIKGMKVGGLQQKIFYLMLLIAVALIGAFVAVSVYQQNNLTTVVAQANHDQQAAITQVSEETMKAVLDGTLAKSTAMQAYMADDLFSDVRSDVLTLQAYATGLFADGAPSASPAVAPPDAADDGVPTAQLVCEEGVDPARCRLLGTAARMSDILLAMYRSSDKISSCFVGTADGCMVLVNDRPSVFVGPDGSPLTLEIRHRPWYAQAAEAGDVIFTGVEIDAYTENMMLECAAPVYRDGELVAVVAADVYLTSIEEYVAHTATEGGFVCVINDRGQVLFSPSESGTFRALRSADAPDLRQSENPDLARFVTHALAGNTALEPVTVDGREYYLIGAAMPSVGWAAVTVVDAALTRQPTEALLASYDAINASAMETFSRSADASFRTLLTLTLSILLLAVIGVLAMAGHIVKPVEHMTRRINALQSGDTAFEMDDVYRTGDEIQVLAESFATLSRRTRDYITQITAITAEKERIGTELALATRIQADMLPNIFPAFPGRPEFDIYASMDPAKEVGGDFYDFFLIDDDHLGIVMADVSGKGVPAALFMMISKILVQNCAMSGRSPAQVLEAVNNQICANNREEMFVTVWFGIFDIKTGKITAANAGHEFPALMLSGGQFELVRDKHGFVIGGMEGMKYKEYTLTMTPGSKLFLYTDGVPEATDGDQQLFGTDRMLEALNRDTAAPPEAVLKNVRRAVDGFVKDAEQFDDLTMLCLEYRGEKGGA